MRGELERLAQAARGGRVAHSEFLEPSESAGLLKQLRDAGVAAAAWGGFPGARRRVVTARPGHVPEASASLAAVYYAGARSAAEVRAALLRAGAAPGWLGDAQEHDDGVSMLTFDPPAEPLLALRALPGGAVEPRRVPADLVSAGSLRRLTVVAAALRADAIGAKGFRVSRAYFAKGVAGGKVSVNGEAAGKATELAAGDELYAEGLGRLRVLSVDGETRRGNLKVSLEVETP